MNARMNSSGLARFSVRVLAAASLCAAVTLPAIGAPAHADGSPIPTIRPVLFAAAPSGATNPDDITKLGNRLYVTYQNNAGPDGSPAGSTSNIVAFNRGDSTVAGMYTLTGRCDGLTADPLHGRLFASVNEDNNSSLYVITPKAANPLAHYTYSPDPAQIGTDNVLNGGTDAISIATDGTVYVAHSNPAIGLNTAAVYTLKLSGTTAKLKPFFGVNDVALRPAALRAHRSGSPTPTPTGSCRAETAGHSSRTRRPTANLSSPPILIRSRRS